MNVWMKRNKNEQINDNTVVNSLPSDHQYGFRKARSMVIFLLMVSMSGPLL